jgi:hypothetical protein
MGIQLNSAQRTPIEDLKQTWRDIADYVVHCEQEGACWNGLSWPDRLIAACVPYVDDDTPADQTNLPTCFGAIVQVLQDEDEQQQGETVSLSTIVTNGVASPHIRVPASNTFLTTASWTKSSS